MWAAGAIGRCTRGVVPRAQVTVTGMIAKVEASADGGTSTRHVETTVAVMKSGADCSCANAGMPARTAATIAAAESLGMSRLFYPQRPVGYFDGDFQLIT